MVDVPAHKHDSEGRGTGQGERKQQERFDIPASWRKKRDGVQSPLHF